MGEQSDTLHGPTKLWLVVMTQGRPERVVEVVNDRFVIGRGETCDLVIEDPKVSREHATIVPGPPGRRLLYDLDSANGTLVNGHLVGAPLGFTGGTKKVAELWGDEHLQFGDTLVIATTQLPEQLRGLVDAGPSTSLPRAPEPTMDAAPEFPSPPS